MTVSEGCPSKGSCTLELVFLRVWLCAGTMRPTLYRADAGGAQNGPDSQGTQAAGG